jgi:hypothetical protein
MGPNTQNVSFLSQIWPYSFGFQDRKKKGQRESRRTNIHNDNFFYYKS